MKSTTIAPTHKAIPNDYATLKDLAHQNTTHEMGLRRAFQELLADTAKLHDWTIRCFSRNARNDKFASLRANG